MSSHESIEAAISTNYSKLSREEQGAPEGFLEAFSVVGGTRVLGLETLEKIWNKQRKEVA